MWALKNVFSTWVIIKAALYRGDALRQSYVGRWGQKMSVSCGVGHEKWAHSLCSTRGQARKSYNNLNINSIFNLGSTSVSQAQIVVKNDIKADIFKCVNNFLFHVESQTQQDGSSSNHEAEQVKRNKGRILRVVKTWDSKKSQHHSLTEYESSVWA